MARQKGTKMKKCDICGVAYTPISADKSTWRVFKGKPSRQPNDWTPEAEAAHKLSHLSEKARRVCRKLVNSSDEVKQEITDFIAELV